MKTIRLEQPNHFSLIDTQAPTEWDAHHTLVRVRRVGICGTDYHAFKGVQPFFSYPRILGHELAVEVVQPDPRSTLTVGDICAVRPYLHCGDCVACRRGITNACTKMQVMGVHQDGGMREYLVVPTAQLHPTHELAWDEVALIEMLAIGAHAVRRANLTPAENVLVIGAGPIGMATAQFARAAGATVAILDINPTRLAFCSQTMHFEHCLPHHTLADSQAQLMTLFGDELPTVVFDATGNRASMQESFQYVAHGGKLVWVGLVKDDITFHDPHFHSREMTLFASRNATAGDFDRVIALLQSGAVSLTGWITHSATAETFITQFKDWLNPASGVIKAVLRFDD